MEMDLWVSVASAVIALAALGLTVFEGVQNRQHNRLSLAPRLRIDFVIHQHEKVARITIANVGLGPAILDSVEMLVDGSPVDASRLANVDSMAESIGITSSVRFSVVRHGEVLSPSDGPVELLRVGQDAFVDGHWQALNAAFRRIGYRIQYRSLYNTKHEHSDFGCDIVPYVEPKVQVLALVSYAELNSTAHQDEQQQLATSFASPT
jgi:hypothetical protein